MKTYRVPYPLVFILSTVMLWESARAEVIINEFMAVNDSTLRDEDGAYSDWIELLNTGDGEVDLAGWALTDAADDLARWVFPDVRLKSGEYLVVFASGKNRVDPGSELHTNFKLDGGGEYLGLVKPDGVRAASEFSPSYPDVGGDEAFGVVRDIVKLIPEGADGRYLVPAGPLDPDWTGSGFDDSSWMNGQAALGYDHGVGGYASLFFTDLDGVMFGRSESVFLRVPFVIPDGLDLESVQLQMQYDDGFVAYLNGGAIGSSNAPGNPAWDSAATAAHPDAAAVVPEVFPVTGGVDGLTGGTNVLAVHGLNHVPWDADPDFLLVPQLEGVNRLRTFLTAPSPGAANGSGRLLDKAEFSPVRGFFDAPVQVRITTDVGNAEIRYTTDFADPTASSRLYSGAITVSSSTVIRAAVFKEGFQPSPMATHSYLFHSDVLTQPSSPPGWPSSWGSKNAEYDMRASVVDDQSDEVFVSYLKSLPSVMITSSMENLFDDSTGIYDHPTSRGLAWERAASVEWIYGDGTSGFGENCGLRIQGGLGGGGRSYEKKSWRLMFKSIYGPSKLKFPVFDWNPDATQTFDQLILRAGGNDRQDYTRDEFARRCQIALGQPGSHGTHIHVYLNGLYWGMYNIAERPAGDFASSYFGGEKEDYDAIAHNANNVIDGDNQAWNAMVSLGRSGLSGRDRYMQIQGKNPDGTDNPNYPHYVDLDHLIDYMLVNIYLGMGDWPGHNWYAARPRGADSDGYKFFVWDGEGAFQGADRTGVNNGAATTYGHLRSNPEFRLLFADHVQRHLFNDGALTPANAMRRFSELSAGIELGVVTENARWGHVSLGNWRGRRDSKNDYLASRRDTVMGFLRGADLYPPVDAPSFNQHGGEVDGGFAMEITASGGASIFYTLDGSDPREAWTGAALGLAYGGALAVDTNVIVKARARGAGNEWSALTEALFVVSGESPMRVSEVMYHPRPASVDEVAGGFSTRDFEFIEFENTGLATVGLVGLRLTRGVSFDFSDGAIKTLDPGESVVVVKNLAAFATRYPGWFGMNIAGEFGGALDNSGDEFSLEDPSGGEILSIEFNDSRGWPVAADGAGHSLVPLQSSEQPNGVLSYGGNWRSSAFLDGSPGGRDAQPISDVVLNEIVAHTDVDQPTYDSNDGIELYNVSSAAISLNDWYLSDDASDLKKWQIPATAVIEGNGWVYFDEITGFHQPITEGFGLSKSGEQVFVSYLPGTAEDRVADVIRFKGQEDGRSLGRFPDGCQCFYAMEVTTGGANFAPAPEVIISEVMFDPDPSVFDPMDAAVGEYFKISNLSEAAVMLASVVGAWRIDGPDFDFEPNTTIPAGGSLLVVSFDPGTDAGALAAFTAVYGLGDGSVAIVGPFRGSLSNSGERIALERPLAPDPPETRRSWVIVDEVIYSSKVPWPSGASGTGRSIVRLNPLLCGDQAFNWNLSVVGGAAGESAVIPVQPVVAVFPQVAEITMPENVNPEARSFSIRNVGVGTLEFSVSDDVGWMGVEPASGQVLEGEELTLSVVFDATVLGLGEHFGTVTIDSGNAANSPRTLDVELSVIERDRVLPVLEIVDAMGNPNQITCAFSKPLESGAGPGGAVNLSNYALSNGIEITGASLSADGTLVTLATTPMIADTSYTLTVNQLQDRAVIPNPILEGTQYVYTFTYTEPVADAGTSGAVVAGATVDLDGGGSVDLDGGPEPLSFSWQQVYGPASLIVNPGRAVAAVELPRKGTYVFRLDVSDGMGAASDTVVFLVSETVNLFEAGQTWKFSDSGVDLGAAWRAVDYDDSSWESGKAQLGYGDGDEEKVVGFGPDDRAKYRTTYFRSEFEVADAAKIGGLLFHVVRDDGAVIYLNGHEVARPNMGEGVVEFQTTAQAVVGGGDESTFFEHPTSAEHLVEGTNTLAVEIHQISGTSSDISFDLFLDTEVVEPDEDGDGMPDYWEALAFGSISQRATGDFDRDGTSNFDEYVAGTDPTDADSQFGLELAVDGGEVSVRYDAISVRGAVLAPTERFYTLEASRDGSVGSWMAVPGHMGRLGDDREARYTPAGGDAVGFFRLRVWVE